MTPRQEGAPFPIPGGEDLEVAWASPHPTRPELAVLLRSDEDSPDQIWLALFERGQVGWSQRWRHELTSLEDRKRPRYLPGHRYLQVVFGPKGARLAVSLPWGAVQLRSPAAGALEKELLVPNKIEDGRNMWPTSTGGLRFLGPERLALALHCPASMTEARAGELKPDTAELKVHVWSDLSLSAPTHAIRTENQAATALASFEDELAVGFQQHRVARVDLSAERCSFDDDLPASDDPRRYRNFAQSPRASLGHPPRWLLYTQDGSRLIAAGGDVSSRVAVDGDAAEGSGDGGEIRWWTRSPGGGLVEGGKWIEEGGIAPRQRFIHVLHLDPSERYLLVGRNQGYVQLIRVPWAKEERPR